MDYIFYFSTGLYFSTGVYSFRIVFMSEKFLYAGINVKTEYKTFPPFLLGDQMFVDFWGIYVRQLFV